MSGIEKLLEVMKALRDPDTGCPWDIKQNFKSIAPYTLEEAFEVVDAIESGDMNRLKDELGDLLLQVVFHAQMAKDAGHFDFEDVAQGISEKMTNRHPHVFGDTNFADEAAQKAFWEQSKKTERASIRLKTLDGVPMAMPALSRSAKLQKRAASVGFDWPDANGVEKKLQEELEELKQARGQEDRDSIHEEFGDVLFSLVNLGRWMGVDPETSLRDANRKFERRFAVMESESKKPLEALSFEEWDEAWERAKRS